MKTLRLIVLLFLMTISSAFSQTIATGSISGIMPRYFIAPNPYANNGCAPTSIAMVLAYWALQHNWTNMFPGVTGTDLYTNMIPGGGFTATDTLINNQITQIATICGTGTGNLGTGNTLSTSICPGLVTYAGTMGYILSATLSNNIGPSFKLAAAWTNLVNSIKANEPMLLIVNTTGSSTTAANHVTPVIAYSTSYNGLTGTAGYGYQYIDDSGNAQWAQFQYDNGNSSQYAFAVDNEIQIVPEPATLLLLPIAGAVFFVVRFRKPFSFKNR